MILVISGIKIQEQNEANSFSKRPAEIKKMKQDVIIDDSEYKMLLSKII